MGEGVEPVGSFVESLVARRPCESRKHVRILVRFAFGGGLARFNQFQIELSHRLQETTYRTTVSEFFVNGIHSHF